MGRFYEKYIVKSYLLFITVVLLCIIFFILVSYSVKLSVIEVFDGTYGDNKLIINQIVEYPVEKVYIYQNRAEKVCEYDVLSTEYIDDSYTVLFIENENEKNNFEGMIKIDAEKKHVRLLSILLGKQKRYVERDLK